MDSATGITRAASGCFSSRQCTLFLLSVLAVFCSSLTSTCQAYITTLPPTIQSTRCKSRPSPGTCDGRTRQISFWGAARNDNDAKQEETVSTGLDRHRVAVLERKEEESTSNKESGEDQSTKPLTVQERVIQETGLKVAKADKEKTSDSQKALQQQRRRNLLVAVASIALAMIQYGWEYTHPITPVQLLASMEQTSPPMSVIGKNDRPSLVDFWAPWCDNCKLMAPTLQSLENEYKDQVNFVMVNGDVSESWPYIEAFGVDAIPHMALVNTQGDVVTALIGPIPKSVLKADLNALLQKNDDLPYKMLDVFANRPPEQRRVSF